MSNLYNSYACLSDIPTDNIMSPEIIKGASFHKETKREFLDGNFDEIIENIVEYDAVDDELDELMNVFETCLHNYSGSHNWNRKVSIAAVGQMACKLARILKNKMEEMEGRKCSWVRKARQYEKDIVCIKKNINMALKLNGVNSLTTEDLKSPKKLRRKLRAAGVLRRKVDREIVNLTIGDKNLS